MVSSAKANTSAQALAEFLKITIEAIVQSGEGQGSRLSSSELEARSQDWERRLDSMRAALHHFRPMAEAATIIPAIVIAADIRIPSRTNINSWPVWESILHPGDSIEFHHWYRPSEPTDSPLPSPPVAELPTTLDSTNTHIASPPPARQPKGKQRVIQVEPEESDEAEEAQDRPTERPVPSKSSKKSRPRSKQTDLAAPSGSSVPFLPSIVVETQRTQLPAPKPGPLPLPTPRTPSRPRRHLPMMQTKAQQERQKAERAKNSQPGPSCPLPALASAASGSGSLVPPPMERSSCDCCITMGRECTPHPPGVSRNACIPCFQGKQKCSLTTAHPRRAASALPTDSAAPPAPSTRPKRTRQTRSATGKGTGKQRATAAQENEDQSAGEQTEWVEDEGQAGPSTSKKRTRAQSASEEPKAKRVKQAPVVEVPTFRQVILRVVREHGHLPGVLAVARPSSESTDYAEWREYALRLEGSIHPSAAHFDQLEARFSELESGLSVVSQQVSGMSRVLETVRQVQAIDRHPSPAALFVWNPRPSPSAALPLRSPSASLPPRSALSPSPSEPAPISATEIVPEASPVILEDDQEAVAPVEEAVAPAADTPPQSHLGAAIQALSQYPSQPSSPAPDPEDIPSADDVGTLDKVPSGDDSSEPMDIGE